MACQAALEGGLKRTKSGSGFPRMAMNIDRSRKGIKTGLRKEKPRSGGLIPRRLGSNMQL